VIDLPSARSCVVRVCAVHDVGPRCRRITIEGSGLIDLVALPGQDVVLHLPDGSGGGVSRRYTIRHLDAVAGRLDLDFVMHGHGPGARFAATVQPGQTVDIFGPRGKVRLAASAWQLFAGDESALPAIAEMVAALPAVTTATVLLEVKDAADEEPFDAAATLDVRWLHRRDAPAGDSALLGQALADVEIPDADRHVYLFAESRVVRRLRDDLGRRGLLTAEISAKGYWNRGAAAHE
jgi:NADPH-dependent ferric siderophore reductase